MKRANHYYLGLRLKLAFMRAAKAMQAFGKAYEAAVRRGA